MPQVKKIVLFSLAVVYCCATVVIRRFDFATRSLFLN